MKGQKILYHVAISICAICCSMLSLNGQNLSNRGTEFWVGYGHHQFMEPGQSNSQEMVLYFSAEQAANVRVSINGTGWVRNYSIPANSVIASEYMPKGGADDCRLYSVPPSFGGTGGEGVFNRGIHIESNVPIVAYAHTFGSASSGATMLMPVETWGHSYISVNSRQQYAANCFSWTYVVANHDNTVVEITPSVLTRNGRAAGVPFTVTLNKGQIYQVIGANPGNTATALEVSGTKFRSIANSDGVCFPVAAFSGSSRTSNRMNCGSGGGDNDNQQLFPTQAWGKRYLTAPTSSSTSPNRFMTNGYKVLVKDPATVVRRNGMQLNGLVNNYYYFESSSADVIEADQPIMLAQFMSGGGCMNGGVGDPEMIYVSPVEQGIKRIGFFRNNQENITVNYLTLIVPNGGTGFSSLRIDGIPVSDIPAGSVHTYPHPRSSAHTIVVRRWSGFSSNPNNPPGQCIVEGDSAYTAITYGLGSVESYGYNAGTLINNLSAIGSIQNALDPATDEHEFTCMGSPVSISALMAYEPTRMVWKLSELASVVTPSADITDNAPVSTGTVLVNGVTYYKYTLPGTYVFNTGGFHKLPILSTHPSVDICDNTEELNIFIEVKLQPVAAFTYTSATDCALDTVYLQTNDATTDGYDLKEWNWQFSDGASTMGKDTLHVFGPGSNQTITLSVVTTEGCVAETSENISVFCTPRFRFYYRSRYAMRR